MTVGSFLVPNHSTLVLVSHPSLASSKTHSAIVDEFASIGGVTVRYIDDALGSASSFDTTAEHSVIEAHDKIVLQFPWYWYSTPAMMKKYLDEVLAPGWAFEGRYALEGKKLQLLITTGGAEVTYSADSDHGFTMDELVAPFKAIARFTKMVWLDPVIVYAVAAPLDEQIANARELVRKTFA